MQRAGREAAAAGTSHASEKSPAILLLHGQPGSARDWQLVRDALGERTPAIAIDRPGWDGESAPGGISRSGEAALAALDAAGAARAVVVGLSFGGAVAAWMAAHHPERVAALVLVSPAANTDSLQPIDRLLAAPLLGSALSVALLSGAGLALGSGVIRRRIGSAFALPEDYLRAAASRLPLPATWRAFIVEQRALLRDVPELESRLAAIACPTTVVIGTADTIVPASAGRRLAQQIPGARLVEIEGGRHVLPAEHPQRLAEVILATCPSSG